MDDYISIFGKITAAKTFMLSKISHIASVLPTPSTTICGSFDREIYEFIKRKKKKGNLKPSLVNKYVLYTPKTVLFLHMHRIRDYWASLKMLWLRRLEKDSSLENIHVEYIGS